MSAQPEVEQDIAPQPIARHWFGGRFQAWLGVALALLALYLALRAVDFGQLVQALREARWLFVAFTLVINLAGIGCKGLRWRALFYPKRPALGLLRLCDLIVIGQAANFYLPARFGELIRAFLTGQEAKLSKSYALGTVAAEKLIDVIVLAILMVGLLPFLALPEWLAGRLWPLVLTALAVSAAILVLVRGRGIVMQIAIWALRPLPRAFAERWQARLGAGLDGLHALGQSRAAAAVWGWTIAAWLASALTNYVLLLAFDLPASPLIALFVLAVLQAGVAVPSTPGKIGVFHYLCVISLAVFHVPSAVGLAYGLVLHALVVGSLSIWAAIALWRRSLDLRRLAEVSQAAS